MKLERCGTSVDYETAKSRALARLDTRDPINAATVAVAIWPDADMTAQGAGGAASRILKRMEAEGLVRWTVLDKPGRKTWGWIKRRIGETA